MRFARDRTRSVRRAVPAPCAIEHTAHRPTCTTTAVRKEHDARRPCHSPTWPRSSRARSRAGRRGRASARVARVPTRAEDQEPRAHGATAGRSAPDAEIAASPGRYGAQIKKQACSGEEARPSERDERKDGDTSERGQVDRKAAPSRSPALWFITCEGGT